MKITDVLSVDPGDLQLAVVGSGGKTSFLFSLARELHPPVFITTTTHLSAGQAEWADTWISATSESELLRKISGCNRCAVISDPVIHEGRIKSLDPETLYALYQFSKQNKIPLLIEADGSRMLPIKCSAGHEPVIPRWVNTVVIVVGLSGLNKILDDQTVHRKELFAGITGATIGQPITEDHIAKYLLHPEGGIKAISEIARKYILLNQADDRELEEAGAKIARMVVDHHLFDGIMVGHMNADLPFEKIVAFFNG